MVFSIGRLMDEDLAAVKADIAAVVQGRRRRPVKVVLECGLLSDAEKRAAVDLAAKAGAAYVKTSTGFLGSGATMPPTSPSCGSAAGSRLKVKATGGIRFFEDAVALLDAGAIRLGAGRD